MSPEPDYWHSQERFYFKDTEEYTDWDESFHSSKPDENLKSAKADLEIRNVQPLFSAETIQEEIEKVIQKIKNSKGVTEKEEVAMAQATAMLGTRFTNNQALKAEKDGEDDTQ